MSTSARHRRPQLIAAVAVAALALAGCGSSDSAVRGEGSTTTGPSGAASGATATSSASSTTPRTETVATEVCDALERTVFVPADPDADAGDLDPTEVARDLDTIAAAAPNDVAAHARALAAAGQDTGRAEASEDEIQALTDGYVAVVRWGAGTCEPEQPTWGCTVPATFETVGSAISVEGAVPPTGGGEKQPQDAAGDGPATMARTELARTADEVTYAWSDDDGLVQQRATVVRLDDGTWQAKASARCQDESDRQGEDEPFTTVGEAIDD